MNKSRCSKLSTSDCRGESGAAVAEVLEPVLLQDDEVGSAVGGEGLDDQLVGDHVVERAVDAPLHVVPDIVMR